MAIVIGVSMAFMAETRKTSSVSGLGTALVTLRARLGLGQIALAKALGVDQSTVGKWETGERPIPVGGLLKIAAVSPEDAASFWLKHAGVKGQAPKQATGTMRIPLIAGGAGGGPPRLQEDDLVEEWLALPLKFCPHPNDTKCITIEGDSMEPTIPNGTVVAVDRTLPSIEKLRETIVAARHATEGLVIKRLVHREGRYRLASDRPGYDPLELKNGWEIVGRVVWWIQIV